MLDSGWKGLSGKNALAYSASSLVMKNKKFYDFGTWCQCYKTFFVTDDEAK